MKGRWKTDKTDLFICVFIGLHLWHTKHLWKREGDERIPALGPLFPPAAGGDQDVLFAAGHVGAGGGVAAGGEFGAPEELAGFGVEGVEHFVLGAADEDQAAAGDDGAAEAFGAGLGDAPGGELGELAQRDLPGEFAGVQVDGGEGAPGGFDGGVAPLLAALSLALGREGLPVAEVVVAGG